MRKGRTIITIESTGVRRNDDRKEKRGRRQLERGKEEEGRKQQREADM